MGIGSETHFLSEKKRIQKTGLLFSSLSAFDAIIKKWTLEQQ